MEKKDRQFSFKEVIIIAMIVSCFMFFLGSLSIYRHLGGINYTLLGNDKDLKKFISTYENLVNNYYGAIDKSSIISGAIDGMYKSLDDPYTTYLDSNNTNNLNDSLKGEYIGIGIVLEDNGNDTIINEVFDNSPAKTAGLKKGDIIIKLNDIDVKQLSSSDIGELIRASEGTIKLEVLRNNKLEIYSLEATKTFIQSVKQNILTTNNKMVGYISISIFNDTADIQFEDALRETEKSPIEALIIDLRGNTGGYLEVAKNIAEMFLEKGSIVYSLQNNKQTVDFRDITNESRKYKIIVLVNKNTASAAEILAAALKYSYDAIVVGNKTFGKGKVQQKSDLIDGTSIKYTTAKWLMPNGKCIDGIGLTPDYQVDVDEKTLIEDYFYTDSQILYILNNLVD